MKLPRFSKPLVKVFDFALGVQLASNGTMLILKYLDSCSVVAGAIYA